MSNGKARKLTKVTAQDVGGGA